MSINAVLSTIVGSGIFTFGVIMLWDKLVMLLGVFGGFLAAMIIPGTMWIINHGADNHLIQQSGSVWIDMAWAVGVGVFVSSVIQGGKLNQSKGTILAAIIAGCLAGYILII